MVSKQEVTYRPTIKKEKLTYVVFVVVIFYSYGHFINNYVKDYVRTLLLLLLVNRLNGKVNPDRRKHFSNIWYLILPYVI